MKNKKLIIRLLVAATILIVAGCGGTGTCNITCTVQTSNGPSSYDLNPYFNETESTCEDERARTQADLVSSQGVCTANFLG